MDNDTRKLYLTISPFFPTPESFRGPFVYDQVKAIERTGRYRMVVFQPKGLSDKRTSYTYEGTQVYLFPTVQMPSYFFNGLTHSLNARSFLRTFHRLGFCEEDVAVAHCHTSPFAIYGLALRRHFPAVKVLTQHHDRDPFAIRNGRLSFWLPNLWYRAIVSRRLNRQTDLHVCISQIVEENLRRFPKASSLEDYPPYLAHLAKLTWMKPLKEPNTYVLYNGVDLRKFHPLEHVAKDTNQFLIGCIGNYIDLKDQITLIKAIQILVQERGLIQVKAQLIGSGPLLQDCRDYVMQASLQDHVDFLHEMNHDQLCAFYCTLHLFVLPTVYDGFGCVFTEAHACGIPFMICDGQGATEYIPAADRSKWVFGKHNPTQLANRIQAYITHRYPQTLCHEYDIDVLINRFLNKILTI